MFSIYKPFRNLISSFEREDSLRVLWAYVNWLQMEQFEFPDDIEVSTQFLKAEVPQVVIPPWQLELIAKEVVINCGASSLRGKTMRQWRHLAKVMNELRDVEDKFYGQQGAAKNIILELTRIAHRQFVWQAHPIRASALMRYLRIFDTPAINDISRSQTGMSIQTIFLCGTCFLGHFANAPAAILPMNSGLVQLSNADIEQFLTYCSRSLNEIRQMLKDEQKFDDRFVYAFNSLRRFPLIQMTWSGASAVVCPVVTHLFWRITSGLYYSLCDHKQFGDAFGRSYQVYVGDVVARAIPNATIIPEQRYGPKAVQRDSVDWILVENGFALFLECKAKRLSWDAKMTIGETRPLENDLANIAAGIVQVYEAIADYRRGLYPHLPYDEKLEVLPAVVTLENWFMFGPKIRELLHNAVVGQLRESELPEAIVEEFPYSVVCISDLESGLQYANAVGLRDYWLGKVKDTEKRDWNWAGYHQDRFSNHIDRRLLFEQEYGNLFSSLQASSEPR